MNKVVIVMLNLFYLIVTARLFTIKFIGGPDEHGCVLPYKYCNYTSSCEPFNKLCIIDLFLKE